MKIPVLIGACFLAVASTIPTNPGFHDEIKLGKEKELRVKLQAALGKLVLSRAPQPYLLISDLEPHKAVVLTPDIRYSLSGKTGILDIGIDVHGKRNDSYPFHYGSSDIAFWNLKLTDAIPITFKGELGAGEGEFDLSGLRLERFELSTGASSVRVQFDAPNPMVMDELRIESGVSKFEGVNLGYANFRTMTFSGGVGKYDLNFDGVQQVESFIKVEMGIGTLVIEIPGEVGVRIDNEGSFLSTLHVDSDIEKQHGDIYYSANYDSAKRKMNLKVSSALGTVTIRHR
ncbi:MAG: hypothetical protein ACP5ON_00790 [Bacteroidota bacterium]